MEGDQFAAAARSLERAQWDKPPLSLAPTVLFASRCVFQAHDHRAARAHPASVLGWCAIQDILLGQWGVVCCSGHPACLCR
mmetsp:Transcript_36995/g.87907  ORF Transcript_36995/g.87907 Transcript_36995/m.87907 type:complete len:81 (+) Transcript_36995:117-359(+)